MIPRLTTLACLAVGALALTGGGATAGASGTADPPAAHASGCNSVHYGGRAFVFYRKNVRCLFAKRWVRRLNRSHGRNKPPGWRCESGSGYRTGGSCSRGKGLFGWHPYD
jgi:hypothetical protein